ncbi:hypothetical protein GGD67_002952 [Bradyrhizobium sp. IAR9]|nr:hypothetical protein [Bradyrhizobium sp. IAR9]
MLAQRAVLFNSSGTAAATTTAKAASASGKGITWPLERSAANQLSPWDGAMTE